MSSASLGQLRQLIDCVLAHRSRYDFIEADAKQAILSKIIWCHGSRDKMCDAFEREYAKFSRPHNSIQMPWGIWVMKRPLKG